MNYFNKDIPDLYRNLKAKIPSLKIKNRNLLNQIHNLNMSSDFWWAMSGEYALLAEKANMLSSGDPRFLNDLKISNIKFPVQKMLTDSLMKSVGKDYILNNNFDKYSSIIMDKDLAELLIDDEKDHYVNDIKLDNKVKLFLPMNGLTEFLYKLRLKKLKKVYFKIKKKLKLIINKNNESNGEIFDTENSTQNFEKIFLQILPEEMGVCLPKWFLWLSEYLVKENHKWTTYFGYELNIYQKILISKSYQKYKSRNIKIITHGFFIGIDVRGMYFFSLFPDIKLNLIDTNYSLKKIPNIDFSGDILFCPGQLPFICGEFFSIKHYWQFLSVYKKALKLIQIGLKNNKKIKIRYKNFNHLNGYMGPQIPEEFKIPIEYRRFEEVYNKYKLIVCMPFGTISAKCYQSDINCITYHQTHYIENKESYFKLKSLPGVFTSTEKFLHELEKKINEL
jgi:hypothetical protein